MKGNGPRINRVGELRPSQLQHTFGIGSIVDLPRFSALVMGLDEWDISHTEQISEPRLLAAVQERAGKQVSTLRLPPYVPEEHGNMFGEWTRVGVPVEVFPRFLRCPYCRHLGPIESTLFKLRANPNRPDLVRVVHESCPVAKAKAPAAMPVRFMLACEAGHLDDFPWDYYVHKGASCGKTLLQFGERGVSGDAASVFVTCVSCNARRSMAPAFGRDAAKHLPRCRGRHPHLRSFDPYCDVTPRAIGLGASNLWFPFKVAVVSIPEAEDPLLVEVERQWTQLRGLSSVEQVAGARAFAPEKFVGFGIADDAEILAAITRFRHRATAAPSADAADVLGPEWEVLTDHRRAPRDHPDFRIEPRRVASEWRDQLTEVLAVTRLREVSALLGFTRIVAPNELGDGRYESGLKIAPLSHSTHTWVPCAETRGEGVFLRLLEERVADWERRVTRHGAVLRLRQGHRQWCAQRNVDADSDWRPPRYTLLHTLAHALIRAFALECGYSASGIRERIYAREGMAGLLLYTAAPDSEGTLGGLVRLADPEMLALVLKQALGDAGLCSSDPMCAEHRPDNDRTVHGAACHACLFAAETSCERGNRFLDRKLLVPTFGGAESAFFPAP
ncbi:DrmB family protein [Micromonospora sp. NPDC002575]|uniref:DrmB family protein n=1 Tax=Micromonospora sp. NPDC002575 TaxID=3364222 RepID=UPI0036C66591